MKRTTTYIYSLNSTKRNDIYYKKHDRVLYNEAHLIKVLSFQRFYVNGLITVVTV